MINQFNADEETVDAPELTIRGTLYRGRVLSIVEWFAFKDRFEALERAPRDASGNRTLETLDQSDALALEFLRAIFPATGSADPIAELALRGHSAVTQAFSAFFDHQLFALGLVRRQLPTNDPPTTTDGTSSPDKTINGPSANTNNSPTS